VDDVSITYGARGKKENSKKWAGKNANRPRLSGVLLSLCSHPTLPSEAHYKCCQSSTGSNRGNHDPPPTARDTSHHVRAHWRIWCGHRVGKESSPRGDACTRVQSVLGKANSKRWVT